MKTKTALWVIGIVLVFAFAGIFLPDEEPTITSNVIKEEASEEDIQEETIPEKTEEERENPIPTGKIISNIGEENCKAEYLDKYGCNGNYIQKKYQYSDCGTSWFNNYHCLYGCENGECIQEPEEEIVSDEIIETPTFEETKNWYKVTRVIDGDTIELSSGERVRLICIDTPETYEDGYQEAKDYLTNLIFNKEVYLEKDISETDRYGRLLRYIYTKKDCTDLANCFINLRIVLQGYGRAYPYSPDTSKCSIIEDAESIAKGKEIGIWDTSSAKTDDVIVNTVGCGGNVYNCGDFNSCSEVMDVFDACSYDVNELDGDDDGVPCESLCG